MKPKLYHRTMAWIETVYEVLRYGLEGAEIRMNKKWARARQRNLELKRMERKRERNQDETIQKHT